MHLKRPFALVSFAALAIVTSACSSGGGSGYNSPAGTRTASAPRKSG